MTSPNERRRYTRIDFHTTASLKQGDAVFHTELLDISLRGALLATPENYELRTNQSVTLKLELNQESCIEMELTMVHSGSSELGFACTAIDVDSASHLRRLIELNMDDADAAERVLEEMLKH